MLTEGQTACAASRVTDMGVGVDMDMDMDVLRHQLPLSIGDKLTIQMKPYCDSF